MAYCLFPAPDIVLFYSYQGFFHLNLYLTYAVSLYFFYTTDRLNKNISPDNRILQNLYEVLWTFGVILSYNT
jgi:hypothetical protein